MAGKGLGTSARRLVEEIAAINSMDVVVLIKQGENLTQVTVRTVAKPERRVAELLTRLDLPLPRTNQILGEFAADPSPQAGAAKM